MGVSGGYWKYLIHLSSDEGYRPIAPYDNLVGFWTSSILGQEGLEAWRSMNAFLHDGGQTEIVTRVGYARAIWEFLLLGIGCWLALIIKAYLHL